MDGINNKLLALDEKLGHYRWLKDIEASYEKMIALIDKEKDFFTVCGFSYAARGDVLCFDVNPHRTIPPTYILEGLKAALDNIKKEIAELEKEFEPYL